MDPVAWQASGKFKARDPYNRRQRTGKPQQHGMGI
jgi:hypothetical protein